MCTHFIRSNMQTNFETDNKSYAYKLQCHELTCRLRFIRSITIYQNRQSKGENSY